MKVSSVAAILISLGWLFQPLQAAPRPSPTPTPTPTPRPSPAARPSAVPRRAATTTAKPTATPKITTASVNKSGAHPVPTATPHATVATQVVAHPATTPIASASPAAIVRTSVSSHASPAPRAVAVSVSQQQQMQAPRARPVQPTPTPIPQQQFTTAPPSPFGISPQPTDIPLVDIKKSEPSIIVDLRYATPDNFTHRTVYPPDTRAMIRPEVMERLVNAQRYLRRYEFNLKIWDAYRPRWAQIELWQASPKNDYVANPAAGAGSLHSWGLAVDATLADRYGGSVKMPTEFDDFTPAAMWRYLGPNEIIRHHLALLQSAMANAGFYGVRSEWWHFTSQNWTQLMPPEEAKRALQAFSQAEQKKL